MKAKNTVANIYWFPLAALYAALILPWSVGGLLLWLPAPPGLQQAWGHGHEMIFGFALAAIAGYITGSQPKSQTFKMISLWLIARLSFWFAPTSIFTALINVIFVSFLAWKLAPVFLRSANKWRNKSTGIILISLAMTAISFHSVLQSYGAAELKIKTLITAIMLLSALMFFMSGRIIAPAIAGYFRQHKVLLKDRVQPNFEGGILILLLLTLILNFIPMAWAPRLMAILLFISAFLGCIRMLRWRPWLLFNRIDLLAMLLGYSWILAGWVFIALSLIKPSLPITQALHAITIGALGTLTITVMARGRAFRVLRDCNAKPLIYILPLLISFAAILRLNTKQLGYLPSILLSTIFWSIAFISLFIWLVRLKVKK